MNLEIDPRLTVSHASMLSWGLEEFLHFCGAIGVHRVGLLLRKLEEVAPGGGTSLDAATRLIVDSGLEIDNLAIGPCFDLHRAETFAPGRERITAAFELAERMGCRCVVITTGFAGSLRWEDAADRFAEAIAPVVARAQAAGRTLAVEHTNGLRFDLGFLHNLRDTVDLAARVGFAVCMEINNVWAERRLEETIRRAVDNDLVRIVQVNDFVVGTTRTPDRAVPGDGDIPLPRILGEILAAGYAGPLELEIVGPRIEEEGYRSAVPRSLVALTRILRTLSSTAASA